MQHILLPVEQLHRQALAFSCEQEVPEAVRQIMALDLNQSRSKHMC